MRGGCLCNVPGTALCGTVAAQVGVPPAARTFAPACVHRHRATVVRGAPLVPPAVALRSAVVRAPRPSHLARPRPAQDHLRRASTSCGRPSAPRAAPRSRTAGRPPIRRPPSLRLVQVTIRARLQTSRGKGKSAFLVLRENNATAQAVLFVDNKTVSKGMVKYASSIPKESIVDVTGVVSKPLEPVASCTQSDVELKVTSIHVASAAQPLPFEIADAGVRVAQNRRSHGQLRALSTARALASARLCEGPRVLCAHADAGAPGGLRKAPARPCLLRHVLAAFRSPFGLSSKPRCAQPHPPPPLPLVPPFQPPPSPPFPPCPSQPATPRRSRRRAPAASTLAPSSRTCVWTTASLTCARPPTRASCASRARFARRVSSGADPQMGPPFWGQAPATEVFASASGRAAAKLPERQRVDPRAGAAARALAAAPRRGITVGAWSAASAGAATAAQCEGSRPLPEALPLLSRARLTRIVPSRLSSIAVPRVAARARLSRDSHAQDARWRLGRRCSRLPL